MNASGREHEVMISSIAERYRRDGYEVAVEPGPGAVPFDLGGYRPDLVARRGDLSLIVAVKTRVDKTSFDRLRPLVDETKRHQGWRFVLVTAQDIAGLDAQEEDEATASWGEVNASIEHANRLERSGESEAAYLALWIIFERMMRHQSYQVGLALERLETSILIRQLYSEGELSIDQYDIALKCEKLRNRIVHGFHGSNVKGEFGVLHQLLYDLLLQWSVPDTVE